MTYKIKKKLLHFETSGSSIAEDFISARHGKVKALRKRLRLCFYIHGAAVLLCVAAAIIFGSGFDILKVSVCVAVSLVFSVFAAGDHTYATRLACMIDAVIVAASVLLAVFDKNRLLYIICAVLSFAGLLSLLLMAFYGNCKQFLEDYSTLSIRRDDYTLLNEVGYTLYTGVNASANASAEPGSGNEPAAPVPSAKSEMRELARQVRKILLSSEEKRPETTEDIEDFDDFFTTNSQ